jgi:hypothetical protein
MVEYGGALEDWEHMLDFGWRVTAVGNSDSHELLDEAGYPRNLIDLGHLLASAAEIDENEVARAVKAGKVVLTTGPQITLTVLDPVKKGPDGKPLEAPIGSLVTADGSGYLQAHLIIDAAPWIDVTRASLLVGQGGPCDESLGDCHAYDVALNAPAGSVRRIDKIIRVSVPTDQDSWIAATCSGDKSFWPVIVPLEIPPLLVSDAINTLTQSVGIPDTFGNLKPTQIRQATAFALTNPVLIDGNGDGKFGKPKPSPAPVSRHRGMLDFREAMRKF